MGQSLIASSSGVLLPLTITPVLFLFLFYHFIKFLVFFLFRKQVSNEDTVYTTLANVSNGTLTAFIRSSPYVE